ncbi:MAG: hypothetical protein ACK5L6_03965 [Anaerorhabdus sp.]|uniref:hypothetical protein n=1 Tax=Anaerorhabdus sp. TaxID=1872524 RepID=UPI003A89F4B7
MLVPLYGGSNKNEPYGGYYGDSGFVSGKKIDGSWFKPTTKKSYGNSAPSYNNGGVYNDPMQAYLDALEAKRKERINAMKSMIDQQVGMAVGNLQGELGKIPEAYQPMKNQSEVNRYTAQIRLRENQANRGALDSGAGRQESLALQNNYGNNLNQIMLQEQAEKDEINRQIANVQAQGEMQKSQADYDMAGDMSSYLNGIDISGFQNQARSSAQNVVNRSAKNMPQKSVGEATLKPTNNNFVEQYVSNLMKSPINSASLLVNTLLKQGKITPEDAKRMLSQ